MNKKHVCLSFAICSLFISKINAQSPVIDSLSNLLQKHIQRDTTRVILLNDAASASVYIGPEKIFQYANEANELSRELNYKKGEAKSLSHLGTYYSINSDKPQALVYYQEALKVFEILNDKLGVSATYNNIAIVYVNMDDYEKGLEFYKKALMMDKALGDNKGMTYSYAGIAGVFRLKADYFNALENYNKAIVLAKETNMDSKNISYFYNNIALVYSSIDDMPKAMEYFEKSLKLNEELGNKRAVSVNYLNIGGLYFSEKENSKALDNFKKAQKINELTNDSKQISLASRGIGSVYKAFGDYPKALLHLQKSLKFGLKADSKLGVIASYNSLGELYLTVEDYNKSYSYANKAYKLAKEIENPKSLMESSNILSKSSEALGLYKEAYKYQAIYKTMSDSLSNVEDLKKITALEYQYKYEQEKQVAYLEQQQKDGIRLEEEKRQKLIRNVFIVGVLFLVVFVLVLYRNITQKRKANRLLSKQKLQIEDANLGLIRQKDKIQSQAKELATTNIELKDINATKDKFFSIISHDLKDPFNTLLGFSDILLKNHQDYDTEQREKYLQLINNSTKKNFDLLNNLLLWSKTQMEGITYNPTKFNVKNVVDMVVLFFTETLVNKNIKLKIIIKNDLQIYTDKDMLEIVLRNLISNAIKFTHKNDEIIVKANNIVTQNKQTFIEISVIDTGVGMTREKQEKLFVLSNNNSTKGTENETGTGLGLIICKEFAEKMGGKVSIASKVGLGSSFNFTIPVVEMNK